MKNILVIALGYFGRGSSVKEAAQNCLKAGARKTDAVTVVIANCEMTFISIYNIEYEKSEGLFITNFVCKKLSSIL